MKASLGGVGLHFQWVRSLRGGFSLSLTTVSPVSAAATDVIPIHLANLNSKVSTDEKQHGGEGRFNCGDEKAWAKTSNLDAEYEICNGNARMAVWEVSSLLLIITWDWFQTEVALSICQPASRVAAGPLLAIVSDAYVISITTCLYHTALNTLHMVSQDRAKYFSVHPAWFRGIYSCLSNYSQSITTYFSSTSHGSSGPGHYNHGGYIPGVC